jgi:multidrug efflux pump subunit AcrB
LDNDADVREVLTDVKAEVDKVRLPSDAEDPNVVEISTDNEVMFQVLMYGDKTLFPVQRMKTLAQQVKDALEGKYGIVSIDVDGGTEFDLQVQVDQ